MANEIHFSYGNRSGNCDYILATTEHTAWIPGISPVDQNKVVFIAQIHVSPENRGTGFASTYIEMLSYQARQKGYRYLAGVFFPTGEPGEDPKTIMARGKGFYQKLGFELIEDSFGIEYVVLDLCPDEI